MVVGRRVPPLLCLLALSLVALNYRTELQVWAYGIDKGVRDHAGKKAPEFPSTVRALDGRPVRLAELRGRVVLLHFWTFACVNCKRMTPLFGEWARRFRSSGLTVVGVHTPETDYEQDQRRLAEYIKTNQILWTNVVDSDHAVWRRYGVGAWPTTVLIDRNGIVRSTFIGDDKKTQIEEAALALLSEHP